MVGHTGPYMTEEWGPEASLLRNQQETPRSTHVDLNS